jgi:hypothetical protein
MREFNKNGQTWTAMRNNSRSVSDYVQMADRGGMKTQIARRSSFGCCFVNAEGGDLVG